MQLRVHPAARRATPARAQARKLPLRGFPYTIVYRVDGDVVHVSR